MYNRVIIFGECPKCGELLDDWQTKSAEVLDKYPIENLLLELDVDDLTAGDVYARCDICNTWLEFAIDAQ